MSNQIPLDDMGSVDTTQIELDEMIELDEPEKPGLVAKGLDIAKEFTAGMADIAKAGEAGYKRRGREAEGEVELGLDMRTFTHDEIKQIGQKSAELRDSGMPVEAQIEQLNAFRASLVRAQADKDVGKAKRFQEAMPKPEFAEDAGFFEKAARGIIHSGPAMATTALSGPAGLVAMFQLIRGGKINELEQKKANELKGVKDSWHIKEIEDKYSDAKNMDAATLHSILSTPVEQFGTVMEFSFLKKMLKSSGAGSRLTEFLKNMTKQSATEGFEEWVQTHTELIADKFQENPDKPGGEVWSEVNDEFWTWKHQGKAGEAFALGATGASMMMGAPAGAANIAQSIEQKVALSDLTSDERGQLQANPLLTADDLRKDRGLPKDEVEVTEEGFAALEEDVEKAGVQVTDNSTVMNSGLGDRGTIILEEKLRTEVETTAAAKAAREQEQARINQEKQEAEEAKIQQAEFEAKQAAEEKREAELAAQRQFESSISGRPGLINKSIQAVATLERSGDPTVRQAVAPMRKAQQALAVKEDSAKRLMTIQNDLRVEMQRVGDPRAAALLMRLDEELEIEVDKADALAAAKEAEIAAKKPEPTPKAPAAPKEPVAPVAPAAKPAVKVPKKPVAYDEYKTKIQAALAKGKVAKAAKVAKTKEAIARVKRQEDIKVERKAVSKTKEIVAAQKIAKIKAAIAAQKKARGIRYQMAETTAGQISDTTMVAGTKFGETVKRIAEGQSVRQTLAKVAKQGKSFYVDVMHPSKIGARIYKQQREEGITPEHAKAAVTRLLDTYGPVYDQVAAKYLKVVTPEKAAEVRREMPKAAVPTKEIAKEVRTSLQRAKLSLAGVTGVNVMGSSQELQAANPVLFGKMKAAQTLGQANALFDPSTKQIYVFTENADTVVKAKQAVWHELGHFSLGELLGPDLNPVLEQVSKKYGAQVNAKIEAGYPTPALATEEVLIDMFTNNEVNTVVQQFKNLWDRFIQKLGFHTGEITERDVRSLVKQIRTKLTAGKFTKGEIERIKKITSTYASATVEDTGSKLSYYLLDPKAKWKYPAEKEEFGTVNNRLANELQIFEKLFGIADKVEMLPGKAITKVTKVEKEAGWKTGDRPPTRTINARALGENLDRVRKSGALAKCIDPKVNPMKLAVEFGRNNTKKELSEFLSEIHNMRNGRLYVDSTNKILSNNAKATASIDFLLGTCQPTEPCKVCYAAKAYFRYAHAQKAFRNTAYILAKPKLWASKVAEEVNAVQQTQLPFVRLLGSGDLTFSEQVTGFNELAKKINRPLHIFSRHHEALAKLKGQKKAPFVKMGSLDRQLYKHYGKKFLMENFKKRGVINAWLYTNESEIPIVEGLLKEVDSTGTRGLGLILSANPKLHKTLNEDAQLTSCPCDAEERSVFGSCRLCAMAQSGCFMVASDKGFDETGQTWGLLDPNRPTNIIPFTTFLSDVKVKKGIPRITQAVSRVAVDQFTDSMKYVQMQIRKFKDGKSDYMNLKDIRWPEDRVRSTNLNEAQAYKDNLSHMRDEARKGTFDLPGGPIQAGQSYIEGKPVEPKYSIAFKSRREYAKEKQAELAKFAAPVKPRKNVFRPGRIAFTKADRERRVIKQKAQVKSLIIGGIQKGAYTGAVRFAPMVDIKQIIKDGKIKVDLHCTPILGKDYDAIPAYGDNTKIPSAMVVPQQHIKPKPDAHTNEAYIKAGTPLSEITFIFPSDSQKSAKAVRIPKDIKYSVSTPAFKKWFKKSVINEKGKPIVLYHGTTHEFTEFDPSSAYLENFLGRALYFTDNPADASEHYGSIRGADIQARISRREDELRDQIGDMDGDDIQEAWPDLSNADINDLMGTTTEKQYGEILKQLATQEIAGQSQGSVMPVYVRIERPLYLNGDKETEFTVEPDWAYYEEEAKNDIDRANYDNNEDYRDDLREKAEELYYEDESPIEIGNGVEFKNAFFELADEHNLDAQAIWNAMREDTNFEYEIAASDLITGVMEHTDMQELQDFDTGEYINREFLRDWIERAGYDGAVVNARIQFPGMFVNQTEDTTHYMPFQGRQVKSIFNMGEWSPVVDDIRYSKAQMKEGDLKGVAFRHPKTKKIYKGKPGQMHSDILTENFEDDKWPDFNNILDMGYITKDDKFVNRAQVAKLMDFERPESAESMNLEQWEVLKYQKVTPAQQKALDHIGLREGKKKDSNLLEMNWFERNIVTRGMDSLYAIAKMEKGKELGTHSGYKSFNMLSNFPAMFSSFLNNGRVKFKDNWMTVTPEADGGLFTVQQKLGEQADSFFKRLTAKSGREILERDAATVASGKPSRFAKGVNLFGKDFKTGELLNDKQMVKDLLAGTVIEYRANKELWDWAENRLRELNTSVLDMAEKSNLIDPAARKKFEREYYVPFFRIMEDMDTGEIETIFPKTGDPTHIAKMHKLSGSHKNVGDPFNNLINNYSFILHESLRNMARGKSLNIAKQMGLIEVTKKAGKNTIGVRIKGQETMYNVKDPMLYNALIDVDTITNGWMSKGLGKILLRNPKLWLTKFVTYDPSFRIANFLRDTLHTSFMQKGFIPVLSSAKGFYHAMRQTPEFKEFASTGGAFTGAYHERDTRAQTAEEVQRLKKRVKRAEHAAYNPIRWLDIYRQIGEASENAARMGVYMIQKRKGKTAFEAAYSAKDLLDFHRSGSSGFLSFLTQPVPFLNARIQGMYKLGRTATDMKTRRNFWVMATLLTAASTAYFFMGPGDDDRYKELTDADKMMYWHFYDVPGVGHIKIPKPFEIGAFFGSIPEAFMEYVEGQRNGKDLAKYVWGIFNDMLRIDMPQSAKVLAQQWANKDYFTGAPIVPARQAGARAEIQYGERTSKLARLAGTGIEKLTGDSPWASPRRIDKVFQDLFSYGAYTTAYLTDMVIQQMDMFPADPALADGEGFNRLILGTGRFIKGEAVPKYTKSQQQFYEMMQEANAAADTYRIYKRIRSREKARRFRKEHKKEIRVAKQLARWQRRISKYNQKIDIILASTKYDSQEKRSKIDALILKRLKVFQRATAWGKKKLDD